MTANQYLLAGQPSELERLQLQSRVWEPSGRRLLEAIGPGRDRALDVGCGVLGWLRLLSRWVGPDGEVVGTDIDDAMLAAAAAQFVAAEQLPNAMLIKDDLFDRRVSGQGRQALGSAFGGAHDVTGFSAPTGGVGTGPGWPDEYRRALLTDAPHRSLHQRRPEGVTPPPSGPAIRPPRRDRLGGLLHEYAHVAGRDTLAGDSAVLPRPHAAREHVGPVVRAVEPHRAVVRVEHQRVVRRDRLGSLIHEGLLQVA